MKWALVPTEHGYWRVPVREERTIAGHPCIVHPYRGASDRLRITVADARTGMALGWGWTTASAVKWAEAEIARAGDMPTRVRRGLKRIRTLAHELGDERLRRIAEVGPLAAAEGVTVEHRQYLDAREAG